LLQRALQHLVPSRRIVQGNPDGVLYERGNIGCLPGCHQTANLLNLIVVESDGDLSGRHTNYHTIDARCVKLSAVQPRQAPTRRPNLDTLVQI
jgi:hypothetical protein